MRKRRSYAEIVMTKSPRKLDAEIEQSQQELWHRQRANWSRLVPQMAFVMLRPGAFSGLAGIAVSMSDSTVMICDRTITPASANKFKIPAMFFDSEETKRKISDLEGKAAGLKADARKKKE